MRREGISGLLMFQNFPYLLKKLTGPLYVFRLRSGISLSPSLLKSKKTVIRWIGSVLIVYQVLSAEGGVKLIDVLVSIVKKALGLQ